jgi:hypothetical protein
MGGYAPAVPFDDEEDERRREDQPYPPVDDVASQHLVRRSGEAVDASAITPAPAAPASYPPVGSTEDLEKRGGQITPYHAAESTPAETRLKTLTDSGAPPVQPLHGFRKGLDILGQIVRPDIEQRLRYRPQNDYAKNLKAAESDVAAEQGPEAEHAKTEETKSHGAYEQAHADAITHPKPGPNQWKSVAAISGPNGEPVEMNEATGEYRYGNLQGAKPLKTSTQTQEQNKLGYQGVIGKLDAAGLPTDPKTIDKSLDAALKKGAITPEEHASARAYQAANTTPGTNLTVHVEGQQAGQNLKDKNARALIDDGNGGTRMGTVAEAKESGSDFVPVKDEQTVINTGKLYNQIRRSTDRLADPRLLKIFDDPMARAIVATATSETEAQHFGILVPHIGGIMIPLPGGTGKFIDSVLQNYKGENKKELQEYLANFWEAREAAMNMMRLQTEGKQGVRSQQQMNAVIAQIPGGQTPNKEMAALQLRNMFANLDDYGKGVPDKLPGYEKYKAKQYGQQNTEAAGEAQDLGAAPEGAKEGRTGTLDGKPFVIKNGRMVPR